LIERCFPALSVLGYSHARFGFRFGPVEAVLLLQGAATNVSGAYGPVEGVLFLQDAADRVSSVFPRLDDVEGGWMQRRP